MNSCKTYLAEPTTQGNRFSVKCYYNGRIYVSGQTFRAVDKCNNCSCQSDGKIDCSKNPCPPSTTPGNTKSCFQTISLS